MGALLEAAMAASDANPAAPEVLLATAFATSRLQATPARTAALAAAPDAELQAAYEALMRRALAQLQRAGELAAAAAAPAPPPASARKTKTPRKVAKAPETASIASPELLKTATKAAYALTEALRHVMTPAAYVAGLVGLAAAAGAHDKVRRRALLLLGAAVRAEEESRRGREADPALATAALAAVEPIAALLRGDGGAEGASELTRQVALGALGALAQAFGSRHPQRFLAAVPAVTALTAPTAPQPVRSSALTCVAAMAGALGRQLIPVLPPTVNAVMAAAQAAAAAAAEGSPAAATAAADSDEEGDKGATVSEAAALELAAALTALVSLVTALGAFLSPHLPQLLSVALNPAVLGCQASHCAEIAAAIRGALARDVPARLLLAPMADALDAAAAGGPASAIALL